MQLDMINLHICQAARTGDVVRMEELARALLKCVFCDDRNSGGYVVVRASEPRRLLHSGTRAVCEAFVSGFQACLPGDDGLCVCVDVPSRMIVQPEERFGECLDQL